jgi:hypothetical protein
MFYEPSNYRLPAESSLPVPRVEACGLAGGSGISPRPGSDGGDPSEGPGSALGDLWGMASPGAVTGGTPRAAAESGFSGAGRWLPGAAPLIGGVATCPNAIGVPILATMMASIVIVRWFNMVTSEFMLYLYRNRRIREALSGQLQFPVRR